jgi:imidazolonepropionase-like amidohydrolase
VIASVGLALALTAAGPVETGVLRLHYLRLPIGTERYEVARDGASLALRSDFDYTDRGGRVRLATTLRLKPDLTPEQLTTAGKTYRFVTLDTAVDVGAGRASVRDGRQTSEVALPDRFFTVTGYAPFAVQMMLVRYWKTHGRPEVLSTVPGAPTNAVRIEAAGEDTVTIGGKPIRLERYLVSGVAWGHESVWLDVQDRLAAVATWACGLAFEAVREEYAAGLESLLSVAVKDQIAVLGRLSHGLAPLARGLVALVGARLVDGTGSAPTDDAAVVVDDGRIVAAGPRARVSVPTGARVIDVHGQTLLPGLFDAHTHVAHAEWGPVYLAAGVTTIRDMGGELEFVKAFRDALEAGPGVGPRLVAAGLVDGGGPDAFGAVAARTPDEAHTVVARYHDAGFPQIKLYGLLQPPVVAALAREAHRLGMTVTGHVPAKMTLREAVDAGMDQIAHLPIDGEADAPEVRELIAFLKERGTVVDPTQSWNELLGRSPDTPIATFQPGFPKVPYPVRALFEHAGGDDVDPAAARKRLDRSLGVVRALRAAGVPIVAGTDEGIPGHSLHREIELYVEAGLTPMQAIEAATAAPARALGLEKEVGTIAPGKRADIVVVDGDPLARIADIRKVRLVMTRGTLYDAASLWKQVGFEP